MAERPFPQTSLPRVGAGKTSRAGRWAVAALVALVALAVVAVFPAGARVALAEEDRSGLSWMSGDEIRSEFSGKSLAGLYPSNREWTETIGADGTTDYREGTKHWKGEWWVQGREFCFHYPPPGIGGCFRITRISENCFELYEFGSVPGRADLPPNIADVWNGRMWHADRPMTCEARPSV